MDNPLNLCRLVVSSVKGRRSSQGRDVHVPAQFTMVSIFLIPAKIWRRHPVIRSLGWTENRDRFSMSLNRIMLPVEPLGAILSGLALAPDADILNERETQERFALRQMDILSHEYMNQHWSAAQLRNGEDKDWLAGKFQRMLQQMQMGLDRRYACYVKQRSLTLRDPLNPVVSLSRVLFARDVKRALREMEVLEDELHYGPRSSRERVVALCAQRGEGGAGNDDVLTVGALRSAAACFSGRRWEKEESYMVIFGIEPDAYHVSAHAQIVCRIEEWLKLASSCPLEVYRVSLEEQREGASEAGFCGGKARLCH